MRPVVPRPAGLAEAGWRAEGAVLPVAVVARLGVEGPEADSVEVGAPASVVAVVGVSVDVVLAVPVLGVSTDGVEAVALAPAPTSGAAAATVGGGGGGGTPMPPPVNPVDGLLAGLSLPLAVANALFT